MWAPAGTPNAIVQTLNSEVSKILLNPETKARLAKVQALGVGDSSANFTEFCKQEAAKYAAIIKSANISLQ
jgi:tripartite-type tricarboxylate transporter receptor subunit TctC